MNLWLCPVLLISAFALSYSKVSVVHWCTTTVSEQLKCEELIKVIDLKEKGNATVAADINYVGKPALQCKGPFDEFKCMEMISTYQADLMTLETGQAYVAAQYFSLQPILKEVYNTGGSLKDYYYVVAVARKPTLTSASLNFDSLKATNSCHTGVGRAAGWVYPLATLMDKGALFVKECNVQVKLAGSFFNSMCAPDALNTYYNPYGDNPVKACYLCAGTTTGDKTWCTSRDPYAGFAGAFKCLTEGEEYGQVAFVRDSTVEMMTKDDPKKNSGLYELLCTDGRKTAVSAYESCNWGVVKSHVVVTAPRPKDEIVQMRDLFLQVAKDFGGIPPPVQGNGTSSPTPSTFKVFDSSKWKGYNLMFSDETVNLQKVEALNVYEYIGDDYQKKIDTIQYCPIKKARWCVISEQETAKCEKMKRAFLARKLKPDIDCIVASSTIQCMKYISDGDADLISLDAGDTYVAGRYYNMTPIGFEDYGDGKDYYYAVAVARKRDSELTLFNLKGKNTCHGGVGLAAGWIIPTTILMQTTQIRPKKCEVAKAMGELFTYSCIPGILDPRYNKNSWNPVNLCENCAAGGLDKCRRNSDELYYGDSGAFRCLAEKGGDVAFMRHTSPPDNTDGHNGDEWARNRRSDDYELLCRNGRRTSIHEWENCHLAKVPSRAIMTSGFKSKHDRDILWSVIEYGQQFYASDVNSEFQMFDSGTGNTDLMFSDSAVRLVPIAEDRQRYDKWLGGEFMSTVSYLNYYDCTSGASRWTRLVQIYVVGVMTVLLVRFYPL